MQELCQRWAPGRFKKGKLKGEVRQTWRSTMHGSPLADDAMPDTWVLLLLEKGAWCREPVEKAGCRQPASVLSVVVVPGFLDEDPSR